MAIQSYEIIGKVINGTTQEGVANLRVEAWDKDIKYNDLLGSTFTDADGAFDMVFDSTYFRDFAPDDEQDDDEKVLTHARNNDPDIFFKVYAERELIKTTEDSPLKSVQEIKDVVIIINVPERTVTLGKDSFSTDQIFKAATFFQESDFSGLYQQYRSRASTSLGFVSDLLANSVSSFNFTPIKPTTINRDEDVQVVQERLKEQQVVVQSVQPYKDSLNNTTFAKFKALPPNLQPGTKVILYEENGKVRYYAIAPEPTICCDDAAILEQKQQLKELQNELAQTKELIQKKDEQINQLQDELKGVRKDQEKINTVLKSDAFARLLKEFGK